MAPKPRNAAAGARALRPVQRTWALSQRLQRGARDPLDYVKSVEAYLGRGFTYTEAPPAKSRTLEGFLFDTKSGYCQQYSGAMALLLRMGGIPARVATGFTSGSYDRKAKEYVVRDLDAHSWVEAWFPDYGWVTFDPTPSAAPPRSQSSDRGAAAIGDAPDLGGGGALDPRTGLAAAGDDRRGSSTPASACSARCCSAAASFAFLHRGRRPAPLPELERALRRTRRGPGPGATLQALEASFARSPDAAGYVRALRDQRYGGRERPARRAPSGAACAASWGAAAGCADGCARGGRCRRGEPNRLVQSMPMADVYDLFQRGTALLEAGDFAAATVPLAKARDLDPEKTSIREALGRAYFRSSQFEAARAEFEAIVERAPTNDYALFCLGRALLELGRPKDARKALALAAGLRPDRRDYRIYRDRARAAA